MATVSRSYNSSYSSSQQAVTAYDVIQQMGREVKVKNTSDLSSGQTSSKTQKIFNNTHLVKIRSASSNGQDSTSKRFAPLSLANERDKMLEEISSLERAIEQKRIQKASKQKVVDESGGGKLTDKKKQVESLKEQQRNLQKSIETQQTLSHTQPSNSKREQLKKKVEALTQERKIQELPALQAPVPLMRPTDKARFKKLEENQTRVVQLQTDETELKANVERTIRRNEVLEGTLTTLKKLQKDLDLKISYCKNQIEIYQQKRQKKEADHLETESEHQNIQGKVSHLIKEKRSYLERIAKEIEDCKEVCLDQIKREYKEQIETFKQQLEQNFKEVQSSNSKDLEAYEKALKNYRTQVNTAKNTKISKLKDISDEYWRYVNESTFRIYNTRQEEYLYPAIDDFAVDSDRRRVFTWMEKKQPVIQGDWKLQQDSDNTFCIFSKTYGEYLYASDVFGLGEFRHIFTWRKKEKVNQAYWKLEPNEDGTYWIFNTKHKEYLFSPDGYAFDKERRHVFTPKNNGERIKGGRWKIIKVD